MKANYKPQKKETTEVAIGSLYEANQLIMKDETPFSKAEIIAAMEQIAIWVHDNAASEKYYMMLCKELSDYTVFDLNEKGNTPHYCNTMAADVIDCIQNRGTLLSIEATEDNKAWEIWIKMIDGTHAYYLFPYTSAVIEY